MKIVEICAYNLLLINIVLFVANALGITTKTINKILIVTIIIVLGNIKLFNGVSLVAFLNGGLSEISIITIFLLLLSFINFICVHKCFITNLADNKVFLPVFIIGVILYLSTVNILPLSIYNQGYQPYLLIILFGIFELYLILLNPLLALFWAISLLGFYFKWQNSNNLWDYVMDPFLWFFSIMLLIKSLFYKIKGLTAISD